MAAKVGVWRHGGCGPWPGMLAALGMEPTALLHALFLVIEEIESFDSWRGKRFSPPRNKFTQCARGDILLMCTQSNEQEHTVNVV
ncbi:unnamed protein product [Colias eurytheme]|nr:unnamed protein product [Colias eurytheme]